MAKSTSRSTSIPDEYQSYPPGYQKLIEPKLKFENVDFFYPGKKRNDPPTHALTSINLSIAAGTVTTLIGPSGSGKSTLLRVVNRMPDLYTGQKTTGKIYMDGVNILEPDCDVMLLRKNAGMVYQKATPFPMSIWDNVAFAINLWERREPVNEDGWYKKLPWRKLLSGQKLSRSEMDGRIEDALKRAAIWDEVKDNLTKPATDLSGGQQQRVCIARALCTNPKVLLLDEVTSALDPISTSKIEDLVDRLHAAGQTILMVTHNMGQAARVGGDHGQTVFMMDGKIVEVDRTEQMFVSPREQKTREYISGRFG